MHLHPLESFKYCPRCGSDQFHIHNFKSKKCTSCGFVYYFNSCAAVAGFITDSEGRLMVARRAHDPAKGSLDLPGGFVDMYETAEDALKREILEETSLKIENPAYLFSIPNIYPYSGFEVHTLDLFFTSCVGDVSNLQANDDVSELFFLSKDEIDPRLFGLTSIRNAVEKWLESKYSC